MLRASDANADRALVEVQPESSSSHQRSDATSTSSTKSATKRNYADRRFWSELNAFFDDDDDDNRDDDSGRSGPQSSVSRFKKGMAVAPRRRKVSTRNRNLLPQMQRR